jgi:ATPase family associated with various cellular activities (AAA)
MNMHVNDAMDIETSIESLRQVVSKRISTHLSHEALDLNSFVHNTFNSQIVNSRLAGKFPQQTSPNEWIILLLALVPHIQPNLFESIIAQHLPAGGDFAEFGGVRASNHRSLLPTGETAQFILAGNSIEQRLHVHQYFTDEHFFFKNSILWLEPVKEGEPKMSGRIIVSPEWVDRLMLNKETAPRFGLDFPAKKIVTGMDWTDAVLHPQTGRQINEINTWLNHNSKIQADANLGRKIKPGYRVLFYGPPGTGKTMVAALLGKQFGMDVYRIDLSQVVSKFIGETEKNLETIFRKAESKNWILFFDEADALFGKRTSVSSAHDKYANQEVSYLLQRVEDYPGLLILASNFKSNLDDAFLRRFHSLIHFPMPVAAERLLLWQKSMPGNLHINPLVNLEELAGKYEMSGASILNAVHYAALQCYAANSGTINQADLVNGIRKEFFKEERSFT